MAYSTTNRTRKRNKRVVTNGIVHINATFNNTLVTITDSLGNTLAAASAGMSGFKGARKSTPFAAQAATEKVGNVVKNDFGMQTVSIYVKGPGPGRDSALRALGVLGFRVLFIKDKTGLPFGGTRPPKRRRV